MTQTKKNKGVGKKQKNKNNGTRLVFQSNIRSTAQERGARVTCPPLLPTVTVTPVARPHPRAPSSFFVPTLKGPQSLSLAWLKKPRALTIASFDSFAAQSDSNPPKATETSHHITGQPGPSTETDRQDRTKRTRTCPLAWIENAAPTAAELFGLARCCRSA